MYMHYRGGGIAHYAAKLQDPQPDTGELESDSDYSDSDDSLESSELSESSKADATPSQSDRNSSGSDNLKTSGGSNFAIMHVRI